MSVQWFGVISAHRPATNQHICAAYNQSLLSLTQRRPLSGPDVLYRETATVWSAPLPRENTKVCVPGYSCFVPSAVVMASLDGAILNLTAVVAPDGKLTLSKSTSRFSGTG